MKLLTELMATFYNELAATNHLPPHYVPRK